MKFGKVKCNWCDNTYDSLEEDCPYCRKRKGLDKENKFGNRFLIVPFWKQLALFGIGCIGFQIIAMIITLFVELINIRQYPDPSMMQQFMSTAKISGIINITAYLLTASALCLVLWKDNIKLLKSFNDWKVFVGAIIGCFAIYSFNILYGLLLNALGVAIIDNDNQSGLESIIEIYPLLSILVFGILGPLCEEITYRIGLYTFFRRINKYLAYTITIIIFTLIHFNYLSTDLMNELWNIPYYAFAAFTFTFLYEKIGFGASFVSHSINNLISIMTTLIQISLK